MTRIVKKHKGWFGLSAILLTALGISAFYLPTQAEVPQASRSLIRTAMGDEKTAQMLIAAMENIADVSVHGAVGDGIVDDAPFIQAAVNSLVDTGGIVHLDPRKVYKVNSPIDVRSNFPIFLVSQMSTCDGVINTNRPDKGGYIRPGANITGGMFVFNNGGGGATNGISGGVIGLTIADADASSNAFRTYNVDAAIFVENATNFTVRDCFVWNIKGSAFKFGVVSTARVESTRVMACGNTSQPAFWVHGGGVAAQVRSRSLFVEESYLSPAAKVEALGTFSMEGGYFENTTNAITHVDADGRFTATFSNFGNTSGTNAVHLKGDDSALTSCGFTCTPTGPTIKVDAERCLITNCNILATGKTGIDFEVAAGAIDTIVNGLAITTSGNIDSSAATRTQYTGCSVAASTTTQTYAMNLGVLDKVVGCNIRAGLQHGIRNNTSCVVSGVTIDTPGLNKNGIVMENFSALAGNNHVEGLTGTGVAIVHANGDKSVNNYGDSGTATATNPSTITGAATVNAQLGLVTTNVDANSAADAIYTLTLTNSMCAASGQVLASVKNGTNTGGNPAVARAQSADGSCVIVIENAGATAFNGSLIIGFAVFN